MPSRGDSCRSHQNELSNASSSPSSRFSIPRNFLPCLHPIPRRLSRPMYFSFFFLPSFFPIHPLSAGRATPVSDYATKTCLLARWIGTCRFSFPLFRRGNGGHGGVLWIVNAHLSSLSWNGVDNDRETGEEKEGKEGLKHRHPKIRHCKFYWKSSLRIMRRYLRRICHLLSITELINISDNIILLRND